MKQVLLLLLIGTTTMSTAQVFECDRYTLYDLKDTIKGENPAVYLAVYFKLTTDTNTLNTGYTDLYFVDQNHDTLNVYNWWGSWLPSSNNIPNDTMEYVIPYKDGITTFPTNFDGHLVMRHPDCLLAFNYASMSVHQSDDFLASLSVFPNPASTELFINYRTTNAPLSYLELYGLSGKLLLRKYDNLDRIDMTLIPPGSYILRLHSIHGAIAYRRITKL